MTKLTPAKNVPVYALIIRATHERDQIQHEAIYELNARGGYLSAEQKAQAGLTKEAYTVLCLTPPKSVTIRDSHIEAALKRLNGQRGLEYPNVGYIYWADVRGNGGRPSPSMYQIINENGGVTGAHELVGATKRKTVELVAKAVAKLQNEA